MRKKKLLFAGIILLSLFSLHSDAQLYLGIEGGGDKNYLNTNISNLVSTQYNPLDGFTAGIPVLYKVNDWLALQTDPGYIQKSYQLARTGFYQGVYQSSTNAYLQLPIMGQLSFGGENLRGFLDLGGYAAYWLSSHIQGSTPNILDQPAYTNTTSNAQPNNVYDEYIPYNYNEKYQFSSIKDNRIELGVLTGLGISYDFDDKYHLFAEGRYYESLTDQQKKYETGQVPRYNETYVFSLGCMLKIN